MNTTRASLRLAAMAGAALLAGGLGVAHAADATQNKGASDQVVATVNGTKLTTRDLASFSRSMAPQGQQINREEALQGLVDRELLYHEADAKAIIGQLDKGGNFSDIAKSKSKDRASAENGGDLGWFNPSQMVPPFSQAVAALNKGQFTKTPVKTQFGYHVIVLDDSRKVNPPTFEEIKDRLNDVVQSQKIGEHLAELRKKAKIDMKGAAAK